MNASATVLVVDDNPINLKLAADVLDCEGYAVFRARDASEAQQIINRSTLDLILMDIQMPGMDGLALTRLVKADPSSEHICIVALTAFAMKGDEKKAMDAGCDGYITKPIDAEKLTAEVAEFLRKRNTAAPEFS